MKVKVIPFIVGEVSTRISNKKFVEEKIDQIDLVCEVMTCCFGV